MSWTILRCANCPRYSQLWPMSDKTKRCAHMVPAPLLAEGRTTVNLATEFAVNLAEKGAQCQP